MVPTESLEPTEFELPSQLQPPHANHHEPASSDSLTSPISTTSKPPHTAATNRIDGTELLGETCRASARSTKMGVSNVSKVPLPSTVGTSQQHSRAPKLGFRLQGWVKGVWKRRTGTMGLPDGTASPSGSTTGDRAQENNQEKSSRRFHQSARLEPEVTPVTEKRNGVPQSLDILHFKPRLELVTNRKSGPAVLRATTTTGSPAAPTLRRRGHCTTATAATVTNMGSGDKKGAIQQGGQQSVDGIAEREPKGLATDVLSQIYESCKSTVGAIRNECLDCSPSVAGAANGSSPDSRPPIRQQADAGSGYRSLEGGGTGDSEGLLYSSGFGSTLCINSGESGTGNLYPKSVSDSAQEASSPTGAAECPLLLGQQNGRHDSDGCSGAGGLDCFATGDDICHSRVPKDSSGRSGGVGNYWTRINVALAPAGRAAHSGDSTWDSRRIFVFGGWMGKKTLDGLHIYDSELQLWLPPVRLLEAPIGRNNHATAVVGHRIYMHGGHDGSRWLDDLHVLDTELISWRELDSSGERPCPRACHSLNHLNSRLYLFGGYNGICCFNDMGVLDIDTLTWSSVIPSPSGRLPRPRNAHSMTAVDDKLVLFGGHDGTTHLDDLFIFDTNSHTWNELSRSLVTGRMPPPLRGHSGTLVPPDRLLIFGGFDGKRRRNDIFIFNLRSNIWRHYPESASSPPCRQRHSACLVGSKLIYVFGGFNGTRWLNDLYALDSTKVVNPEDVSDASTKSLLRDLNSLVGSRAFADVCIVAEGKSIPAHRNILALRSEYFRSMFSTPMLESQHQCVQIVGWRYRTVLSLLEFLYTGNVAEHGFDSLCDLLGLADSLALEPLKTFCSQLLRRQANATNVCRLLAKADRFQASDLRSYCQQYILDYGSSIAWSNELEILTKSPQLLCDIAKLSLQCRLGPRLAASDDATRTDGNNEIDACSRSSDEASNQIGGVDTTSGALLVAANPGSSSSLRRLSSCGGSVEMERMPSLPFTSSSHTSCSCSGLEPEDEPHF